MDIKINYVHLEPAAFMTDADFLGMDAEQRGVYCTIIFLLYSNGGSLKFTTSQKLAPICGCYKTGNDWLLVWDGVKDKFIINENAISHKRVNAEIANANGRSEAAKNAANIRWGAKNAGFNAVAMPSQCQNKIKENKIKEKYKEKSKEKKFAPPTLVEINAYIKEKSYAVNGEKFFYYYESVGWIVGGKKQMKSWKASIANWHIRDGETQKPKTKAEITAEQAKGYNYG